MNEDKSEDHCNCNLCVMIRQTTWVSVRNRLPEEGTRVLTYSKFEESIKIDYFIELESQAKGFIWACRLEREESEVTHWMPLPKPPKE